MRSMTAAERQSLAVEILANLATRKHAIKGSAPMKRNFSIALLTITTGFLSSPARGQQPEPGVWFGILVARTGASANARFEVNAGASGTVILRAPFGKTPATWGSIAVRPDSSIEFRWTGDPPLVCALRRADPRNYEGLCQGSDGIGRRLSLTRNGPPQGLELPVSDTDFRILARARRILSGPSVWNRLDDRACEDDATRNSWSLFCALHQASVDVAGVYLHLRPVMMELRATVGEVTNNRLFEHQLRDYNNLDSTTHAAIETIFERTEKRLRVRAACTAPSDPARAIVPNELPLAKGAAEPRGGETAYWREGLTYTVQKRTYWLSVALGPVTGSGRVPNDWLDSSTAVSRRAWKRGELDGLDVKGELRNGNHWRYFFQCGESVRYYDVPAEAAAFFDRMIDGAHSRGPR